MSEKNGHKPVMASGARLRAGMRDTYAVPLLSGEHVLMRPIDLGAMVLRGEIPDLLLPAAYRALFGDLARDTTEEKQAILDTLKLVHLVLPLVVVEPRIVENPQADDEIAISDLDWADQFFLFSRAIQGVSALRIFRDRQTAGVEAGQNGTAVRAEAE